MGIVMNSLVVVFSLFFIRINCESDGTMKQNVTTRAIAPVCPNKNVYCHFPERDLKQKEKVTTLPGLGKVWRVDLEFKPLQYTKGKERANIIHISQGGRETRNEVSGDRVLSIMTKPHSDLCFSMFMTNQAGVKDNWNNCYNGTQVDQWTGISVSQ